MNLNNTKENIESFLGKAQKELGDVKRLLEDLVSRAPLPFGDAKSSSKEKDYEGTPGVYLILDEKDEIIYTGETHNIAQRMRGHWGGVRYSSFHRHLIEEENMETREKVQSFLRKCRVVYTAVKSKPERLVLEGLCINLFKPKYNKEKD